MVVTPFSSIFTEITKGVMTMKYFQTKSNPMRRKSPVFEEKKTKQTKRFPITLKHLKTFEKIQFQFQYFLVTILLRNTRIFRLAPFSSPR